ncbi:Proteasome subunit beta type-5-A [Durusdinium trenchii]|uniref:Proteasome subunit beta type-5-A n=1 Tax=Durusdinium trenchii TaxID=1381693 RepID=A0ABP0HAE7_9DINO
MKWAGATSCSYCQDNPKVPGTNAFKQYNKYKAAVTIGEARELGADARSLKYDWEKGFLKVDGFPFQPADKRPLPLKRLEAPADPPMPSFKLPIADADQHAMATQPSVCALPVCAQEVATQTDRTSFLLRMQHKRMLKQMCQKRRAKRLVVKQMQAQKPSKICLKDSMYRVVPTRGLSAEGCRLRILATAVDLLDKIPEQVASQADPSILVFSVVNLSCGLSGIQGLNDEVEATARNKLGLNLKSQTVREKHQILKAAIVNCTFGENHVLPC